MYSSNFYEWLLELEGKEGLAEIIDDYTFAPVRLTAPSSQEINLALDRLICKEYSGGITRLLIYSASRIMEQELSLNEKRYLWSCSDSVFGGFEIVATTSIGFVIVREVFSGREFTVEGEGLQGYDLTQDIICFGRIFPYEPDPGCHMVLYFVVADKQNCIDIFSRNYSKSNPPPYEAYAQIVQKMMQLHTDRKFKNMSNDYLLASQE